jgi:hypothetical protein
MIGTMLRGNPYRTRSGTGRPDAGWHGTSEHAPRLFRAVEISCCDIIDNAYAAGSPPDQECARMSRDRIGDPFPAAIIACLRAGRAPTADELRAVAERIECEARLGGRFADAPLRHIDFLLRAALQATGMVEPGVREKSWP